MKRGKKNQGEGEEEEEEEKKSARFIEPYNRASLCEALTERLSLSRGIRIATV